MFIYTYHYCVKNHLNLGAIVGIAKSKFPIRSMKDYKKLKDVILDHPDLEEIKSEDVVIESLSLIDKRFSPFGSVEVEK